MRSAYNLSLFMFCLYTDFFIAHGSFAKDGGIVADIENDGSGQFLIPAEYWSDYTEEREYFFIGGLQYFFFISIHEIAAQMDYKAFIEPLTAMIMKITGWPFEIGVLTKADSQALDFLISDRLSSTESARELPPYLRRLFANITHNVQTVEINMAEMNWHNERAKTSHFGFKLFKTLFFADYDSKDESITFALFLRLFARKLESILVFNEPYDGFEASISLNAAFVRSMFCAFDVISDSFRLQQRFEECIIVEPKQDVAAFIQQHQAVFKQRGWAMKRGSYEHIQRGSSSDNCLIISPM